MSNILEDLSNKMEGQPQEEVSQALVIYKFMTNDHTCRLFHRNF